MNRVRSQLDSLLETPHESPAGHRSAFDSNVDTVERRLEAEWEAERRSPGRAGSAGLNDAPGARGGSADLARIRASLDQLAGKLGSLASQPQRGDPQPREEVRESAAPPEIPERAERFMQPQPHPQPRPQSRSMPERAPEHPGEPQHTDRTGHTDHPDHPDHPDHISAIGRQMRDELTRLRHDVADVVASINRGSADSDLHDEVRALADAVARLEQHATRSPGQFEGVSAELHNLRAAMEDMASRPAPGLGGVSRSIESGYAELAGRVEETIAAWMKQASQSRNDDQLRNELAQLGEHAVAIRDAIDHFPERFSLDAIESRLDRLAGSIETLSASDERTLARHFEEIDARLDEVTRALVAVSAGPGSDDAFERIEARIATLSKTVEQIAEDWEESRALPAAGTESFAGEVKMALEAIDRRLGELGQTPASEGLDTIASRIATLSDKLDNLPSFGAAAAQMGGEGDVLLSRLDAIAARLDSLDDGQPPAGQDADALASIERQLADLAARFDTGSPAPAQQGSAVSDEIIAMLQQLSSRIDTLGDARPQELPEAEQLAALERQLGGIVSQLDTIATSGFDLKPISERLDSIEQQVANSRDIAIDVASQAAERAVGLVNAGQGAGQGNSQGIDSELIEALRTELHNLDSNSRDIGARNVAAFETVHEALSVIVDRLGDIEARMRGTPARSGYADERQDAAIASQAMAGPAAGHANRGEAAERDVPEPPAGDGTSHENVADEPLAAIEEAPPLDPDELPRGESLQTETGKAEAEPAEVEDVPLEPGSGAPDFAALVRQASARRKAGDKTGDKDEPAHAASDLIAAARRAAQSAAQDAAAAKSRSTDEKAGEPAEKKSALASGLKALLGRRKMLLMSTAIVAFAIFATPMAVRFLRPSQQTAEAPAAAQQDTVPQTGAVATMDTGGTAVADPAAANDTAVLADKGMDGAARPAAKMDNAPVRPATGEQANAPAADQQTATAEAPAAPTAIPAPMAVPVPDAAVDVPAPPEKVANAALRQAAEGGDGPALFEVARRYTDGDGVDRDLAKAAQWYEYSARAGFAPAQYRLGNFFEKGHGVTADIDKAVLWYQRAAEQGNALAMHNLAVLYTSGLVGGSPDMKTAIEWFRKAADLGVKDSQVNLGILYTRGMGVKEDLVEAYKWFAVAARAGDSDAASKRDMLAGAMRPDQLKKARGLASLWKPAEIDPSANAVDVKPEWKDTAGRRADLATGPLGQETTAAIASSQMIERAQTLLAEHGFDAGPADGMMGKRTRDAIKAFQRNAGMPVDGQITDGLLKALENDAA